MNKKKKGLAKKKKSKQELMDRDVNKDPYFITEIEKYLIRLMLACSITPILFFSIFVWNKIYAEGVTACICYMIPWLLIVLLLIFSFFNLIKYYSLKRKIKQLKIQLNTTYNNYLHLLEIMIVLFIGFIISILVITTITVDPRRQFSIFGSYGFYLIGFLLLYGICLFLVYFFVFKMFLMDHEKIKNDSS